MLVIGDTIYNLLFPEECSIGTIVSRESETEFIAEYRNRITGELYIRNILDFSIYD